MATKSLSQDSIPLQIKVIASKKVDFTKVVSKINQFRASNGFQLLSKDISFQLDELEKHLNWADNTHICQYVTGDDTYEINTSENREPREISGKRIQGANSASDIPVVEAVTSNTSHMDKNKEQENTSEARLKLPTKSKKRKASDTKKESKKAKSIE